MVKMALSALRLSVRFSNILGKNAGALNVMKTNNLETQKSCDNTKCLLHPAYIEGQSSILSVRKYSKHVKHVKHVKHHDSEKHKYKQHSDYDSLSSSDGELLGHRGESDFWRRKIRTFHGILDVNNDGVISYDDFKLLADRFVNLGHLSEKHKHEFHHLIQDLWEKLWGEITPYNLVTVERYLEDMHHVLNDRPLKKKVHGFLPFLFKAIDHDKSGTICIEDFKLFYKCLGLDEADAVMSFRLIDKNCDGKLTLKEFVTNGRQFFLTENEDCTSKYFWGPLVAP